MSLKKIPLRIPVSALGGPVVISYRTSLFSKYQTCAVGPVPPRPQLGAPKPKDPTPRDVSQKGEEEASARAPAHQAVQNLPQTGSGSDVGATATAVTVRQESAPLLKRPPAPGKERTPSADPVPREEAGLRAGGAPAGCPGDRERRRERGGRRESLMPRRGSSRGSSRKRRNRRGSAMPSLELDEDEILRMYGEDGELLEDPEDLQDQETLVERIREQKDLMQGIKFQPWPVAKKLRVLSLARSFVVKHEGRLSRGRGYQQKGQQLLKQLKRSWNNLENWITPWEMKIKRIESHFGSVVTSYFIFLRWLLWINLWLTVGQYCFVILPEMLVGSTYGSTERKAIPGEEEDTAFDLKTIWDAEGVVRYSPIFYGYYGNSTSIGSGYRLPLAYLSTTLVSFVYSFIVVLKKMASNSRQSRLSNKDEQFTFAWKLYTDWDYMVGNPETATTKHASIVTTMKEAIVEEQEKKHEENKYLLIFLRILANVIILILLATSTYVIYLFVERSRELELKKLSDKSFRAGFWAENELTVVMTMISTLFPNVLDLISLMEKYHPRTALRLQLARIFVLNLINLYTLFIALYNKQNDLKAAQISCPITTPSLHPTPTTTTTTLPSSTAANASSSSTSSSLAPNHTTLATSVSAKGSAVQGCAANGTIDICWETRIGQEVFKLTIMDLIFTLGQIFIIDVFRSIFVKYCNNICCWDLQKKFPEYPDFKTAENLLHLINNQGVVWLGVFFSPGLALLNFLKLVLLMYVRCWTVLVCNVPQERIFRASRSNNFYFALLLVMLFLCMLPPLFAIVVIQPSDSCGPFSGLEKIYHVLTYTMENELPRTANNIINYVASPGVILPIFMLMGMTIYYLIAIGRSLRDANNELRMQLEYERTEGRKKVYAMADAKHGLDQPGGPPKPNGPKMASAVTSVLKAAQMAKMFSSLKTDPKRKLTHVADTGQKMAPAVRPKPHVPVAVVHGKRSLKRNAAAVRSRAATVRQLQQHSASNRRVTAGTNGHMLVTTSASMDTPEVSSNDEEDEVFSSSHSSSYSSGHQHEDPSAVVDDTGHLRPVTEDDIHLDLDSVSEEDEEEESEEDAHDEDDRDLSAVLRPETRLPLRAGRPPPVGAKPSRPSGKVGPTAIPKITVIDFGEDQLANDHRNEDASPDRHVEPNVIVEDERAKHRQKRRDDRALISQSQQQRTKQRKKKKNTKAKAKTNNATRGEEDDPVQTETTVVVESDASDSGEPRGNERRENNTNRGDRNDDSVSHPRAKKAPKQSKFSNILARFQKMDESG